MLTPNDIADALEELVRETFPDEDLHRDLVPQGFARPCNLIVQETCEIDVGHGSNSVLMQPTYTLTTFVPVDEYHHSHLAALHLRQMALAGLLASGFIKVNGRASKVERLTLGGGYDYDTVTVTFSYTVARGEFMDIPQRPLMLELHTTKEVTT